LYFGFGMTLVPVIVNIVNSNKKTGVLKCHSKKILEVNGIMVTAKGLEIQRRMLVQFMGGHINICGTVPLL